MTISTCKVMQICYFSVLWNSNHPSWRQLLHCKAKHKFLDRLDTILDTLCSRYGQCEGERDLKMFTQVSLVDCF